MTGVGGDYIIEYMIMQEKMVVAEAVTLDLSRLGRLVRLEKYPKGHIFFEPEQPATALYLIRKGRIQLYHRHGDARHIVADCLRAGSFFGESTLLGRPHYLTAEAVSPVEVYAIRTCDIDELQRAAPALVAQLTLDLIKQLEHIQRVYTRTPLTTPARLAGLLLLLMEEQTNEVAGFSHQHLAEMLGTHREFVTQTLATFRDKGVVETGYKRIHILDPHRLRSMAGG